MRGRNIALVSFAVLAFAVVLYVGWRREGPKNFDAAFQPGGFIEADLSVGGYTIRGTPDNMIRVEVDPNIVNRVHSEVKVSGNQAKLVISGPSNNFHATIYVPDRSNLDVRQTIGELRVYNIQGDRSLRLNIGRIQVEVPDPAQIKTVDASVRIGEVHASAWRQGHGGFFPAFRTRGQGSYTVRASVDIGQVELSN